MYRFFLTFLIFFTINLYLRLAVGLFYLFRSRKENEKKDSGSMENIFKFHVFIPCLQEQDRIGGTIDYFHKLLAGQSHCIYIITTEKETTCDGYAPGNNTFLVADDIVKKVPNVKRIHYPHKIGRMADQINYALNVPEFISQVDQDDMVCIYNADSNPDFQTFNFVKKNYHKSDIFQQYGNYAKSIDKVTGIINKLTIYPSILWQNRWSFLVEFFNSSINFSAPLFLMPFLPLSYPVGHGLFIKYNALLQIKHFSKETHNEDLFLGVELGMLRKKILPIPYFDLSDTPCSPKSIYDQKSNWFFGPFDAPSYFFVIKKKYGLLRPYDLLILSIYCVKLFSLAIYWVVGPFGLLVSFLLLIYNASVINAAILIFYYFGFLVMPLLLTNFIVFKIKKQGLIIYSILGSIIAYGVHGLAALYTVKKRIFKLLFSMEINKRKTAEI